MLLVPQCAQIVFTGKAVVRLLDLVQQTGRDWHLTITQLQALLDFSVELLSRRYLAIQDDDIDSCVCEALIELTSASPADHCAIRPLWLPTKREVWFRGTLIKKFTGPAGNQEPVLIALQAARWPPVLANPFSGCDAAVRLGRAAKALNRRQRQPFIRFRVMQQGAQLCCDLKKGPKSVPCLEENEI
jgi:hypothetical protein